MSEDGVESAVNAGWVAAIVPCGVQGSAWCAVGAESTGTASAPELVENGEEEVGFPVMCLCCVVSCRKKMTSRV